jgi:hypothetical protein
VAIEALVEALHVRGSNMLSPPYSSFRSMSTHVVSVKPLRNFSLPSIVEEARQTMGVTDG